jgi:glycosyltransferase involved in cell wall biosynthesis
MEKNKEKQKSGSLLSQGQEVKRILTIAATPYFSDRGCHIRIFLEAKYLKKFGNKVKVLTYHLGKNVGDFEIERIEDVSWYKKTSPGFAWGKLWLDLKLLKLCYKEIKGNKTDVIHAHLYEGLLIGWLAQKMANKKIPIVLDLQGDLEKELESYNKKSSTLLKNIFVWISKIIINKADAVVVSSENSLKSVEKVFKNKNKIFVIKDGVDLDLFKSNKEENLNQEAKQELKEIKKWKKDSKTVIYSGGLEEGKGFEEFLREFLKIQSELKKWKLLVYGQGSKKSFYKNLVNKKGFQSKIFFAKENSFLALPLFLKTADVAVDPKKSSSESSGKLMNYMASNLPVICFDNKFNRQRLGEEGFYLNNILEFKKVLNNFKPGKIKYDLKKESEEEEVYKIQKIINNII